MQTVAEWAQERGFPTFAPLFEKAEGVSVPLYLKLLNLSVRPELRITVEAIRQAMVNSDDPTAEVVALLNEYNWRSNLVAVIAVLLGVANKETFRALWQAFDNSSLVTPQLAFAAFRCDPNFEVEAYGRIKSKQLTGRSLAALVALCQYLPGNLSWLDRALADTTIQKILEEPDGGGHIALYWKRSIEDVLR